MGADGVAGQVRVLLLDSGVETGHPDLAGWPIASHAAPAPAASSSTAGMNHWAARWASR